MLAIDGEELHGRRQPVPAAAPQGRPPVDADASTPARRSTARARCTFQPLDHERERLLYLDVGRRGNRERVAEAHRRPRRLPAHARTWAPRASASSSSGSTRRSARRAWSSTCATTAAATSRRWLIERLRRELLGTRFGRTSDYPRPTRRRVFHGHMACLINENSASRRRHLPGDVPQAGLGPLIGKRTWGGVVGITDRGPLIDGGSVNVPEFGNADADGAVDHRGPRRRARHRGRERPEVGHRRPRPAAREGDRGGARADAAPSRARGRPHHRRR